MASVPLRNIAMSTLLDEWAVSFVKVIESTENESGSPKSTEEWKLFLKTTKCKWKEIVTTNKKMQLMLQDKRFTDVMIDNWMRTSLNYKKLASIIDVMYELVNDEE